MHGTHTDFLVFYLPPLAPQIRLCAIINLLAYLLKLRNEADVALGDAVVWWSCDRVPDGRQLVRESVDDGAR